MRLQKFVKSPVERKRYRIAYSDWLDSGETITSVTFSVLPIGSSPLVVDAEALSAPAVNVVFFVSGGLSGTNYIVDVQVTTSGGQIKEDTIYYAVRNA